MSLTEEERFVNLYRLMKKTRKNKRRGKDSVEFEANWAPLLVRALNERDDQPYYHGCEFLGSHIRPNRIHLNNKTYDNAIRSIEKMNESRYKDIDAMVSVFNSYSGLLKNRTDYKRLLELRDKLSPDWWKWLEWDSNRKCITYKQGYSPNERLKIKYHLKLKHYDTIRDYREEERSLQRAQHAGIAA